MPQRRLSRFLARPGHNVLRAALLLALACGRARAGGDPPPDPPPLPFIDHVTVGRAPCDTCAPRVCPGEPAIVTVSGHLKSGCYQFRGLHDGPPAGDIPVLVAEFVIDTCRASCPALIVPFSGAASLPPQAAGLHQFDLRVRVRSCPDTTVVVDSSGVGQLYTVESSCPPAPIPVDSLVRTFVKLAVVPAHPCDGDAVMLQLIENGCPPCVHLVSFGDTTSGHSRFEGVIEWTPECREFRCSSDTLLTSMGILRAGQYRVFAPMTVHVLGTPNPDSTLRFTLPFEFQVGRDCGSTPPPCVDREMLSPFPPGQCAVSLAPGSTGSVPLLYSSELAMAGVQGEIEVPAPFRVTDVKIASHLTGVHVQSSPAGRGASWVVFTDPGVLLPPGAQHHLFNVTVAADPTAANGASALMSARITLAAGAHAEELPLCIKINLAVVATRLCVAGDASVCDVNHDGRLDVRDLVRMVGCLGVAPGDSTGTGPCVDCNHDAKFDLTDIFCCARDILRGPAVPHDSLRADPSVSVSFDPIETIGPDLLVRVRVHGARALGAALLRFEYPGAHWSASGRAEVARTSQPVDADWYPIADFSTSGEVRLGAIRLGDTGLDEFSFEMMLSPRPAPLRLADKPDRLETVTADLAARDGSVVTPVGPPPSIALVRADAPGGGALELSPARPNPFTRITTFVVQLPASAVVDLAVHDIAGRRVATIAHATYAAGPHSFTWDAAGAKTGLYFVRLTVDGQVLTTRAALLGDSRP